MKNPTAIKSIFVFSAFLVTVLNSPVKAQPTLWLGAEGTPLISCNRYSGILPPGYAWSPYLGFTGGPMIRLDLDNTVSLEAGYFFFAYGHRQYTQWRGYELNRRRQTGNFNSTSIERNQFAFRVVLNHLPQSHKVGYFVKLGTNFSRLGDLRGGGGSASWNGEDSIIHRRIRTRDAGFYISGLLSVGASREFGPFLVNLGLTFNQGFTELFDESVSTVIKVNSEVDEYSYHIVNNGTYIGLSLGVFVNPFNL